MDRMVILFWALAFLDMVSAFPSGPPNTRVVCQEMFPFGHGVDAQSSPPPYRIDISQNIYTANEKIRVSLKSKTTYIRGFFIQARVAGNCGSAKQKEPVGRFELLPNEYLVQTIDCDNRSNSSLAHKTREPLAQAVFYWNSPATPIGHIYFVATVVFDKTKFWTTVYSDIVRDIQSSANPEVCPGRMYLDPQGKVTTSPPPLTTNEPIYTTRYVETTTEATPTSNNYQCNCHCNCTVSCP